MLHSVGPRAYIASMLHGCGVQNLDAGADTGHDNIVKVRIQRLDYIHTY